jgi:hypothetical protein
MPTSNSDLATFENNLYILDEIHQQDDGEPAQDDHDRHVIFISHYKQEAGTEAALMRHALKELITVDLASPVFVDSEDLTDLATLQKHVEQSDALVVLLTPGIFTRPWCILEIVTAFKKNVLVLPVEVQRPGSSFKFPDDSFYFRLHRGEILDKAGLKLLKGAGVSMKNVDSAIRNMFMKIALPYSPHKSEAVRGAELLDIMKRVPLSCWDSAQSSRSNFGHDSGNFAHRSSDRKPSYSKFAPDFMQALSIRRNSLIWSANTNPGMASTSTSQWNPPGS